MRKVELTAVIVLTITVGGISTSHAYTKRKRQLASSAISMVMPSSLTSVLNDDSLTPSIERKRKQIVDNFFSATEETEQKEVTSSSAEILEEEIPASTSLEDVSKVNPAIDYSYYEEIEKPKFSGVSYLGNNYELGYFSGTGYVPTWTNQVFQWNDFPSHYLAEYNSNPGQAIFNLRIGSEVTISGQSYIVYDIVYNQANDQEGLDLVLNSGANASIQVCTSTLDDATLNIYFLN